MKLHYYSETDSLYIDLASAPGASSSEISDGLVVDYAADGTVVGLDIQHASERLELTRVDVENLPLARIA